LYMQLSQGALVKWNVIDHHFLHFFPGWRLEIIPPSV
jgi:hypothetical protein